MTIGLNPDLRDSRLQVILDSIDYGADEYGTGKLQIYSGTRPVTGGSIGSCVLLAEYDFSNPCGTITSGVLTFTDLGAATGLAVGNASWARIIDNDDNFVMDLSVGTSGTDVIMDSTAIEIGSVITCILETITEGNA